MKIFYSELSANPRFYSFGYSIYANLEQTDNWNDIYSQGFQPCIVVAGPKDMLYMARGSRVVAQEFKELHEHKRIAKKFEEGLHTITVTVYPKADFKITNTFLDFLINYFNFRHGKGSMPKERLMAILGSQFLNHIVEYKIQDSVVGYMLEVHGDDFIHFWYQAYDTKFNNKNLGAYMVLDLVKRTKKQKKSYTYLGVSYGTWMKYKTNYQPLEWWNGQNWVQDPKSKKLKELMKVDYLRNITLTDLWREGRKNFYPAPISYTNNKEEIRYMLAMMIKSPRLFLMIMAIIALAAIYFVFS